MKQNSSLVKFSFIVFLMTGCLIKVGLKAQILNPHIHSVQYSKAVKSGSEELLKDAIEDVSKRTLYSSTWKTKNGKVIAKYSSMMINYPDAQGNLQPVDLTLHSCSNGWVADKQPNPCYFHSDRSTSVTIAAGKQITFNKNCTINDMPLDENIVSIKENKVKLDLSQGVSKEVEFIPGGVEANYIFNSPLNGGITVKEELDLPEGCILQRDTANGRVQPGDSWSGDYVIMSSDGKQVLARLAAAECYDAKKHWGLANYSIQKKDGKNILVTSVPSNWLSKAVYPVILDPRIVGTTALFGGTSSPSCPYPSFHTDSIQVTIPADITISFFTIDYAYVSEDIISDQIPTNDGIFYLSTSCARTDTTSCADSPGHGDTAGICYLIPFEDFHNPMTCCYGPSCSPQKIWVYSHLSRRYGGSGCDSTTIWYTRGRYVGFQYYFSAYVEGYTDSITGISYTPTSQCSNLCSITMNASLGFGVPPYKVSHPWATRDTIVGSYNGCSSQGLAKMKLKVPGCPYTCGKLDTILIPSPVVVDACGDTATPAKPFKYVIKPTPVISYVSVDTVVCSGLPIKLSLKSCVTGTTFTWTGTDNASGTTDSTLIDVSHDTGNAPMKVTYTITGSADGCNSDTIKTTAIINPYPVGGITGVDTLILGSSEKLIATGGGTYSWSPSAGLSCTNCPSPVASPTVTTKYLLTITDSGGCEEIIPFVVNVLDQNIIIPNVITPNGDQINDLFIIKNLQDYPNSKLTIYDRWGKQVYTTNNYQNNWNGGNQSDGVYYYVLTLSTGKKYQGYLQIIK